MSHHPEELQQGRIAVWSILTNDAQLETLINMLRKGGPGDAKEQG